MTFVVMGSAFCLYLMVRFHKIAKNQEVFLQDGMIYAHLIFNSHNWSTTNKKDLDSRITAILNEVLLKKEEDQIRIEVRKRPIWKVRRLRAKRFWLIILSIIFVLIGWAIIYLGAYYEDQMKAFFENQLQIHNTKLVEWMPAFAAGFSGYLVPYLLGLLTDREEWDFAEEILYSSLRKNYWCSIFNILVFLGLQY